MVKGGGHSYFGNSNAADSLLVWTRALDRVEMHDAFVPAAAPSGRRHAQAVSVGAGAIWGRVYDTVAVAARTLRAGRRLPHRGRVGVRAGRRLRQLLEGIRHRRRQPARGRGGHRGRPHAHREPWRDPDLFFALRGGGGGTFGVVTRLTLATHRLPETFGAVLFTVTANTDAAWTALVARVVAFYAEALFNPTWGEQLRFDRGRRLSVSMLCHGLDRDAIDAAWKPFLSWIAQHAERLPAQWRAR